MLTYRKDLTRPLTSVEVDDNFHNVRGISKGAYAVRDFPADGKVYKTQFFKIESPLFNIVNGRAVRFSFNSVSEFANNDFYDCSFTFQDSSVGTIFVKNSISSPTSPTDYDFVFEYDVTKTILNIFAVRTVSSAEINISVDISTIIQGVNFLDDFDKAIHEVV